MVQGWKLTRLGDICSKVCSGGTPSSKVSDYYDGGTIPWLNTKEIDFNRIRATEKCITESGLAHSSAKWIEADTVIVAMYGATAGKTAIAKIPLTTNQACCNLEIDSSEADYRFIYYWFKDNYALIASLANGGAQQNLNAQMIKDLKFPLPTLLAQKAIAEVLSALDDKIENNTKINHHLEQMAQAIWSERFSSCEPNGTLGDYFPVRTGRKDANVAKGGTYPFFSCSQNILYTDNYSFDAKAILLAGNGDFNVKVYSGKFEAYQRTYVLIPNNERHLGLLYYAIKQCLIELTAGFRGSVIRFITKGNIESFKLYVPSDSLTLDFFNGIVEQIAYNDTENSRLAALRDTLLPRLMSGEVSVCSKDR